MALFTANFLSKSLKRSVTVDLVLPTPAYPELMQSTNSHPAPYPIVYLMSGDQYLGNAWFRYTSLERIAETHNIAVVTFNTERAAGLDETVRIPLGKTKWNQLTAEDSDFEEIRTYRFSDFLVYELPDFLEANFRISPRPEDRFIAGQLESAYSAVLHAAMHPERYKAAGAFSYFQNNANCRLYSQISTSVDPGVPVFLAQTASDENPDRSLIPALSGINMTVERYIPPMPGSSRWDFWEQALAAFLDWLPRSDHYAANGLTHRRI